MIKTFASIGRNHEVWPVVLLLFAVLVPALCLVWFMSAAMRNERFAARQKLAEAYRGQLSAAQARLERHWKETLANLETLARTTPPSAAFLRCIQAGNVDSVILFDEPGRVLYPNTPSASREAPVEVDFDSAAASQLEYLRKDFLAAADRYEALAKGSTNASVAARAWQARARNLVRAGQKEKAIRLIDEVLGETRYDCAVDSQGRLIGANAELMVLELLTNRASSAFQLTARRLHKRLMDYENPVLAASQRRFLMKEMQRLAPETGFPTLAAEELAAQFLLTHSADARRDSSLQRTLLPHLWQLSTRDQRVTALVRSEKLLASLRPVIAGDSTAEITLVPPEGASGDAFITAAAGAPLPGWQLALTFKNQDFLNSATANRVGVYLWTGVLVMAAMGILTLLAIRLLRRQTALARLKNDLVATVSHELKTPLSSMRVLVETLLNSDEIEERKARDYLQLIAQENERLSRLIQNFLTFSRMERKKYACHFVKLPAQHVINSAVQAVRERFNTPGCRFEVQVDGTLPEIIADADALSTALINLLDNAWKYSEEIKHIVLRACVQDGKVVFLVRDNGIGIPPRERSRIFNPFHQVDDRLSRPASGCGLGLSIVQFIVNAHHGNVSVESEPGRGSTFTVSVPFAPAVADHWKEAVA